VKLHEGNFCFFLCLVNSIHHGLKWAFAGPLFGVEKVIEGGFCESVIVLPL
jgi:hypothetical protein